MSRRKTYTEGMHRAKMERRRKARKAFWRGVKRQQELIEQGHTPLCSIHHDASGCRCNGEPFNTLVGSGRRKEP